MFKAIPIILLTFMLSACQPNSEHNAPPPPVSFHEHDECHICGMLITRYPGPKAQVFQKTSPDALKFCSTRDFFAYLLEPGMATHIQAAYVHDMAHGVWEQPSDQHLTSAKTAWYVIDHPLRGAMGPTLASFAKKEAAMSFAKEQEGKVLSYDEIGLEHLN